MDTTRSRRTAPRRHRNHRSSRIVPLGLLYSALALGLCLSQCTKWDEELETALCKSLNNYIYAVRDLDGRGLEATVYFPGVTDYKGYVRERLTSYLSEVRTGQVTFDPQGLVLIRFLGLGHHRYLVQDIKTSEDAREAWLRIGIHFAYDSNIAFSDMESGTQFFVPGKPWGKAYILTIGGENPAPREQLSYAEIVVHMRKTNMEDFWQVREMEIDPDALKWEISLRTDF